MQLIETQQRLEALTRPGPLHAHFEAAGKALASIPSLGHSIAKRYEGYGLLSELSRPSPIMAQLRQMEGIMPKFQLPGERIRQLYDGNRIIEELAKPGFAWLKVHEAAQRATNLPNFGGALAKMYEGNNWIRDLSKPSPLMAQLERTAKLMEGFPSIGEALSELLNSQSEVLRAWETSTRFAEAMKPGPGMTRLLTDARSAWFDDNKPPPMLRVLKESVLSGESPMRLLAELDEDLGLEADEDADSSDGDATPTLISGPMGFISSLLWPHNRALIAELAKRPHDMHSLSPRDFEVLVAELLSDLGWQVELTPQTRDHGRDIIATGTLMGFPVMALVECKKYNPNRKVGLSVVRDFMYTVRDQDRASIGIIATSSTFSEDVFRKAEDHKYQLHLHDFERLKELLASYGQAKHYSDTGLWAAAAPPAKRALHFQAGIFKTS